MQYYQLEMIEAGAKTDLPCKTAYIQYVKGQRNFRISIFEEFADKCTLEELIFVILHEILHSLKQHLDRRGERDGLIWNLAGDHIINKSLREDVQNRILPIKIRDDIFIREDLVSQNLSTEEVYEKLKKEADQNTIKISLGADGKSIDITMPGKGTQNVPIDMNSDPETGDEDGDGSGGKTPVDDLVNRITSEMRTIHENLPEDARGFCSGAVFDLLKDLIFVELPLEQLLTRSVSRKLRPAEDTRSWRSLNKIYQGVGFLLPGKGEEVVLDTGVYVVDSSGSMSDDELMQAGSAVVQAADLFSRMIVIKHDWDIKDEKVYEDAMNEKDLLTADSLEAHGRGGTSHKPVFDRIEEIYQEGEYGLGIVMLVTDYYSDVNELVMSQEYEWVDEIPIQVILPDGHDIGIVDKSVDKHPIVLKAEKRRR